MILDQLEESIRREVTEGVEYLKILAVPDALLNLNQKFMVKECAVKGSFEEVENVGSWTY